MLCLFRKLLLQSILEQTPGAPYVFTEQDLAEIQRRKQARYDLWNWNFGQSLACTMVKKQRIEGCGTVEAHLDLSHGIIQKLAFTGDFFSVEDPQQLADLFAGCPLRENDLAAVLKNIHVGQYIMGLQNEDFLSLLLQ